MGQTNNPASDENIKQTLTAVSAAEIIETAPTELTSHQETERSALKDPSTIAGYPITHSPKQLNSEQRTIARELLLQTDRYIQAQTRCKNDKLIGYRFTANQQITEVAVGSPCNKTISAYQAEDAIKIHGAMLPADTIKQQFSLVGIVD